MTGSQRAVLWIGLLMVAINLIMKWPQIRSVIFTGATSTAPGASGSSTGSSIGGAIGKAGGQVIGGINPAVPAIGSIVTKLV
jgi:hypothetical protein